jgi:hypothetical protein
MCCIFVHLVKRWFIEFLYKMLPDTPPSLHGRICQKPQPVWTKNVSFIDFDPAWLSACVAGSRQVTRLEAENSVPDRLWYCPPSAAKPVIECKYKLRPGLADLHLLVGSWSLQEIAYICFWLESSFDPPEGHPGQLAYTFLIRILSTSFISVSIFSVSRVSISMVWTLTTGKIFLHCRIHGRPPNKR